MELKIHPVFSKIFPLLPPDKFAALESSCLKHGIIDPIKVWVSVDSNTGEELLWIIDGHNRYSIATKHGIPYEVKKMSFQDRASAEMYIRKDQGNRRNLSDVANKCNIASIDELNGGDKDQTSKDCGVSVETIEKAIKIKDSIDRMPDQLQLFVLTEQLQATQKDIIALGKLDEDEFEEGIDAMRKGICPSLKESMRRARPSVEGIVTDTDNEYIKHFALNYKTFDAYVESNRSVLKVNASNYMIRTEILEGIVQFWEKYPPEGSKESEWANGIVGLYTDFKDNHDGLSVFDCYKTLVLVEYTGPQIKDTVELICDVFEFFQRYNRNKYMKESQKAIRYQINRLDKLKQNPEFEMQLRKLPARANQILREEVHIPHEN